MGDAIVADVKLTLEALGAALPPVDRAPPPERPAAEGLPDQDPMFGSTAMRTLAEVFPDNGIVALEAPSATLALRNQLRLSQPGSYYFGAGGGLGFGLSASLGVQLAQPDRPVVCVVGEGSAQYAIQAFWTAAAYEVPVTVLVLRNDEYAILKWFSSVEEVEGAPGLDLPRLEVAQVAEGYGVRTRVVDGRAELRSALADAIASPSPELVEVRVAPGMNLG
jgi:benzoylformate decarboxylase